MDVLDMNGKEAGYFGWVEEIMLALKRYKKKFIIMDVILEESSRQLWEALGEVLLENLILQNKYGWISLGGTFPSEILAHWTYELSKLEGKNELLCYKNVNCVFPNRGNSKYTSSDIEWLSLSPSNSTPLDINFFKNIRNDIPIGCDIVVASLMTSVDFVEYDLFYDPKEEHMKQFMSSFVIPLEDSYGYIFGAMENHYSIFKVTEKDAIVRQIKAKLR